MALSANTIFEVQTGGVDTNGGGFNPTGPGVGTADLTVTGSSGQNAAPTVSSATYTFVATDVGAWLFIKSGSTFIPGWYKITAVAAGVATLNGTIGQAVKYTSVSTTANGLSTAQGCSTATTGTAGVFCVDYTQGWNSGVAPIVNVTDGVTAGTTTITSATAAFTKAMIGNLLYVQGGTGSVVAAWYEIATYVSATEITVDRSTGLTAGTGVTLTVGGPLLTFGGVGATGRANGSDVFVKTGTYVMTSSTNNVAGGRVSGTAGVSAQNPGRWEGYATYRGDKCSGGSRPILDAGAVTAMTTGMFAATVWAVVDGINLDGKSGSTNLGLNINNTALAVRVNVTGCPNGGFTFGTSSGNVAMYCRATANGTHGFSFSQSSTLFMCEADTNTGPGFSISGFSAVYTVVRCIASGNTGASTDGFFINQALVATLDSCTSYGNGRHGFNVNPYGPLVATNCLSEANVGYGFTGTAVVGFMVELWNCGTYNNTSGAINTAQLPFVTPGFVTNTTGSFFTNAASGDFSLNATANQGALARAAGVGLFPRLLTTGYPDIGAAQHADPAGGGGMIVHPGMTGGIRG